MASERYRRLKIWKSTPVIDPAPIEKFQDILVQGDVLTTAKRVKFQDLILAEFASTIEVSSLGLQLPLKIS